MKAAAMKIESLKALAFGFFCWFIFSNIVFIAIAIMLLVIKDPIDGRPYILLGIWLPTLTMLIILFTKKKVKESLGILIAIFLNTTIVGATFHFSIMTLAPAPSVYLVFFIAIMAMVSPGGNSNLPSLLR